MKKTLLFAFILLTFSSCALSGFTTKTPKSEISDVQRFIPVCDIDLLDKYDNGGHSDSLSELCRLSIDNVLARDKSIGLTGNITIKDTVVQNKVNNELRQLIDDGNLKQKAQYTYLPTVDSILKQNGKRFGLLVYHVGFERTKQNWGEIIFKSIAYYYGAYGASSYNEAFSKLTLIIYDAENKNLPFYHFSIKPDKKPTRVISQQLEGIIDRFWK